jgi:hypothetical protein
LPAAAFSAMLFVFAWLASSCFLSCGLNN